MTNDERPLPPGWRWARLGEVCNLEYGQSLPSHIREKGIIPVYGSNGCIGYHDQALTNGPTIIVGRKGSVGAVHFSQGPCWPIDTTYYVQLKNNEISLFWLAYCLRKVDLSLQNKATAIPGLNREDAYAVLIPLPPLQEQTHLVFILSSQLASVDRARTTAEAQLAAARKLQTSYLQEAFCHIVPMTATKDRNKAPVNWKWRKLTELARLESGHTPSRNHSEWWGGSIPWLSLADIRSLDGKIAYETAEYTNEQGIANSSARILPVETVALSRTASVGYVTIMGKEMATSQDFVNWVCGPDLYPRFLLYLFLAARDYIRSVSSGAIHKTVYMPTARSFEVCIPSIQEQRLIADKMENLISGIDKLTDSLRIQLDTINQLPAAILRRAFNGEL